MKRIEWIHPEEVLALAYFSKGDPTLSYQTFIEENDDFISIQNLILED